LRTHIVLFELENCITSIFLLDFTFVTIMTSQIGRVLEVTMRVVVFVVGMLKKRKQRVKLN